MGESDEQARVREQFIANDNAERFVCSTILAERYVELASDDSQRRLGEFWLARNLSELNRPADALERIDQLLEKARRPRGVYLLQVLRGQVFDKTGQPDAATEAYELASELRSCTTPLIFAAGICFRRGEPERCEALTRQALLCDEGEFEEAHLNLGGALLAQGRYDEAEEAYTAAIEIDPDYTDAHHLLRDLRSFAQASQARDDEADDVDYLWMKLTEYREQGFWLSASHYARLLCRYPNEGTMPRYWLGVALSKLGRPDAALECAEQLIESTRTPTRLRDAFLLKGGILEKRGQLQEAHEAYDGALEADPESAFSPYFAAGLFLAEGRAHEALAAADSVIELTRGSKNLAVANDLRGQCFVAIGDYTSAHDCFREASRLNPEDDEFQTRFEDLQAALKL